MPLNQIYRSEFVIGAKKRLCNLNTLKREAYRLSPLCAPLHSNKTSKIKGTPHNLVRQLLLNFLYDRPNLETGQEKNIRIAYFRLSILWKIKKNITFPEIPTYISISSFSINSKRFCLSETIIIAFNFFGNPRQGLES